MKIVQPKAFVEDLLRELVGRKIKQSRNRISAIPCQAVDT